MKLDEPQEILKKNGFLMEKHYQNASVSFQDATGQEKTVVLNLKNIGCKANKKEDTKMFVINYFNSRVKGTKITSVDLF